MRRAAIVSPVRTAIGKFGGALRSLSADALAAIVIEELVKRTKIGPSKIDDVVFGQGYPNGENPAIGRYAAMKAGLPIEVPGYQLDMRCGSGLQQSSTQQCWSRPETPTSLSLAGPKA
jgi:acetyl-CoA C-acetyltransferase